LTHSRGLKANSVARDQAPAWVIGADPDDPYRELGIVPIETSPASPRSVPTLWDDALMAWVAESDQPAGSPVAEKASNPAGSVEGLAASAPESIVAAGGAVALWGSWEIRSRRGDRRHRRSLLRRAKGDKEQLSRWGD
jgi:hypothetical protein